MQEPVVWSRTTKARARRWRCRASNASAASGSARNIGWSTRPPLNPHQARDRKGGFRGESETSSGLSRRLSMLVRRAARQPTRASRRSNATSATDLVRTRTTPSASRNCWRSTVRPLPYDNGACFGHPARSGITGRRCGRCWPCPCFPRSVAHRLSRGSLRSRTVSIRIREVRGRLIALCGARSIPRVGDIYLDDGTHHALASKFAQDWKLRTQYPEDNTLREIEESNNANRDAWDEWMSESKTLTPESSVESQPTPSTGEEEVGPFTQGDVEALEAAAQSERMGVSRDRKGNVDARRTEVREVNAGFFENLAERIAAHIKNQKLAVILREEARAGEQR